MEVDDTSSNQSEQAVNNMDAPSPVSSGRNSIPLSETDDKFCKSCNIKFLYVDTFAAHKKYYCKDLKTNVEEGGTITPIPRAASTCSPALSHGTPSPKTLNLVGHETPVL